jgi:hypothetical protein
MVQGPLARETAGEARSFAWPSGTAGTHGVGLPSTACASKSPFDICTDADWETSWPTALVMSTPVVSLTVTKYRDIPLFAGVGGPVQSPTSINGDDGVPSIFAVARETTVRHKLTEAIRATSRAMLACMKCLHL